MFTRVWRSQDGMPGNEVTGIAQDGSGYLWIAYMNGLAKFDGLRFESVPLPLPEERSFSIRAMLRTSGDRFWLALDGGTVVLLAPGKTNLLTSADGLSDARPLTMAESRDGAIWIGYSDASACRIVGRRVTRFTDRDGLAGQSNCRLATDVDGRVWFAQARKVGIWDKDRFRTLLSFTEQHVRIARARGGGVWICADSKIFSYREGGELMECARLRFERASATPEVLLEDRGGTLWVGTFGSGLFRCQGTNTVPVETSQRTILSLYTDREGSVWAGTAGGGLNRMRPRILELQDIASGLPFDTTRSMCLDGSGRTWAVARNGGLARLEGKDWKLFGTNEGWSGDLATCVTSDAQGAVWIGTYRKGALYRWHNGIFTKFDRQAGLGGSTVRLLLADRTGTLWVGLASPSCLQRFKNGKFERMDQPANQILCVGAEDSIGNIWLGTADGSLLRVKENKLVDETQRALQPLRAITSLLATSDGSLWIGYLGAGVGRLRGNIFRHIGPERGMPSGRVCDMMSDTHGGLWFSTEEGILRVSQAALDEVADGKAARVNAIYYGSDELLSLQGFSPYSPGAARGPDGKILFPLLTGLAVVHPDRISTNRNPPQVIIESATADNQTMVLPEGNGILRLRPGLRKLEFQFTAPTFIAPTSIRFRHQLEGVDEDWIELGTQRRVTFTRLPPGHYSYRVSACNHAGLWNEVGAQVQFEVLPFFWQTTAFKWVCLVSIPFALAGMVRYGFTRRLRQQVRRLEQEVALNRERARIAKDIHDDLGANLTQISLLSELVTRHLHSADTAGGHVQKLAQTARQAFTSLDEIVWAVNPRNDTLTNLLDYLAQFALDYLSPTQVRCRLDFPVQPPARTVSAEVRHTLYLVLKEALNNVIKYAAATEVRIRATLAGDKFQLTIEDDGVGFDMMCGKQPEADGLSNMRQRSQEVGGICRITSHSKTGTTITIEVPLAGQDAPPSAPSGPGSHS